MDIRNYFIEKLSLFTEEYLIALGNKGLYRRAKKDIENNIEISHEIEENCIKFHIDGNTVELGENNKCTCISRDTCKHIIIAYLYLLKNSQSILGIEHDKIEKVEVNFDYLLELDYTTFPKAKQTQYKKALKRIEIANLYTVSESNILEVAFGTYKVKFFSDKNIEEANCTCKSKELCNHKLEALAYYRHSKGLEDKIENLIEFSNNDIISFNKGILEINEIIDNFVGIGLVRYKTLYLFEQLSIKLRSYNMPALEKKVNSIMNETEKFVKKSSNFNLELLKNRILNLKTDSILLSHAIETKNYLQIENIVGKFRKEYHELPKLTLYSLGYERWQGTNETIYFSSEIGIFTYTNFSNSTYSSKELNWRGDLNFNILKTGAFQLINAKADINNRLSSSKETKITIVKTPERNKILNNYSENSWEIVLKRILKDKTNNNFLIKINRINKKYFNKISQIKIISITDIEGNTLSATLPYKSEDKAYFNAIEKVEEIGETFTHLLGKLFIDKGNIHLYPLVFFDNDKKTILRS